MHIVSTKIKCDFCKKEEVHEHEQSYSGGRRTPKGWLQYDCTTVCPDCQKKHTITELRATNKVNQMRLASQEKEDDAEDY